MPKLLLIALSLAFALALSSCASSGRVPPPHACPQVPKLPQHLLNKTDHAGQVRRELYELPSSSSPSETRP